MPIFLSFLLVSILSIKNFYKNKFLTFATLINLIFYILFITIDIVTLNGFNEDFFILINNNILKGNYNPYLSTFLIKIISITLISFFSIMILKNSFFKIVKKFSFLKSNTKFNTKIILLIFFFNDFKSVLFIFK